MRWLIQISFDFSLTLGVQLLKQLHNKSCDETDFESGVPDEKQCKTSSTDEGTCTKPGVLDIPKYDSESKKESWGDSDKEDEDDEDESDDESDDDKGNDDDDNDEDDGDNGDNDDNNDDDDLNDDDDDETDSDRTETVIIDITDLNQSRTEEHEEEEDVNDE
nr:hypothetical protein [Tanacetum cinerariifolium]